MSRLSRIAKTVTARTWQHRRERFTESGRKRRAHAFPSLWPLSGLHCCFLRPIASVACDLRASRPELRTLATFEFRSSNVVSQKPLLHLRSGAPKFAGPGPVDVPHRFAAARGVTRLPGNHTGSPRRGGLQRDIVCSLSCILFFWSSWSSAREKQLRRRKGHLLSSAFRLGRIGEGLAGCLGLDGWMDEWTIPPQTSSCITCILNPVFWNVPSVSCVV